MTERLGILDWGIGGFGVFRALRRKAPNLPIVYLSDSGYTPYGRVGPAALRRRVVAALGTLAECGATSIVVACNAASTVLDADRRARARVPIFGVIEPALCLGRAHPAATLAVIGGARTIRSGLYRRGLAQPGRRVIQRIAQPLSAHIEAGTTRTRRCAADLDRILAPLRTADAVLLACTHYPAISESIARRLHGATLLDPAEEVANEVLSFASLPRRRASDLLLTTGAPVAMRKAAERAWGLEIGRCERVLIR